jgi:hypothetical protein
MAAVLNRAPRSGPDGYDYYYGRYYGGKDDPEAYDGPDDMGDTDGPDPDDSDGHDDGAVATPADGAPA